MNQKPISMTLASHLVDSVAFNQWANTAIVRWLSTVEPSRYDVSVASSFTSIKALLKHILQAEAYYASIIMGRKGMNDDALSMQDMFGVLLSIDRQLLEWAKSISEEALIKNIRLNRSPIEEQYSIAELLTHLTNHSSYHRGQLLALRGQLSLPPAPKIDFYRYVLYRQSRKN